MRTFCIFITGILLVAYSCKQQNQHRKLKLKKDVFGESNPDITLEQILTSKQSFKIE